MKKVNYFTTFAVAMAIVFASCNNEVEKTQSETSYFSEDELMVLFQMRNENDRICIDEAAQMAFDAISFFDSDAQGLTRSGRQNRRIESITALRNENAGKLMTRTLRGGISVEIPDTLAYVFNFADNAGFAIIAADTRISSSILAFADYGTLGDTIDNPGMAIFLESLEGYIEYSIVRAEHFRDSLKADILARLEDFDVINIPSIGGSGGAAPSTPEVCNNPWQHGPWVTERVLRLMTLKWGQSFFPFNNLVPLLCPERTGRAGGRAPAGCTAAATAIIMAHWHHPPYIDGFSFDWDLLNRFTHRPGGFAYLGIEGKYRVPSMHFELSPDEQRFVEQVSRLMERIGANINMRYGCGGSAAFPANAVTFLRALGFLGGDAEYFNLASVLSSLRNHRPVLIEGANIALHRGHAWVVDGYLLRTQTSTFTLRRHGEIIDHYVFVQNRYYLHYNWGWDDANSNGFFAEGVFNSARRSFLTGEYKYMRSADKGNSNNDVRFISFCHNVRIYPNIRR